jgi:hypothetical protein
MKKRFRYGKVSSWYKGNTHIHSVVSDGALDFTQLAARYAGAEYDFLCRTDHWTASNAADDPQPYPLLWLDGVELDGHDKTGVYYHIVCLGTFEGIARGMDLESAVATAREQDGLVILAHPHWTGNSLADALRLPFDGVEVYNNVCQWMNGKGESAELWDALLEHKPGALVFASDDAHLTRSDPGWNGGWIWVNAEACTDENILLAIRRGEFYASTGPQFIDIGWQDGKVRVKTSPVKFIRLVGPRYQCDKAIAADGEWLSEAEFSIPDEWETAYIQLEDDSRRLAWTNTLLV